MCNFSRKASGLFHWQLFYSIHNNNREQLVEEIEGFRADLELRIEAFTNELHEKHEGYTEELEIVKRQVLKLMEEGRKFHQEGKQKLKQQTDLIKTQFDSRLSDIQHNLKTTCRVSFCDLDKKRKMVKEIAAAMEERLRKEMRIEYLMCNPSGQTVGDLMGIQLCDMVFGCHSEEPEEPEASLPSLSFYNESPELVFPPLSEDVECSESKAVFPHLSEDVDQPQCNESVAVFPTFTEDEGGDQLLCNESKPVFPQDFQPFFKDDHLLETTALECSEEKLQSLSDSDSPGMSLDCNEEVLPPASPCDFAESAQRCRVEV